MSRTRSYEKKIEGKIRKEEAKEVEKEKEAAKVEEVEKASWAIGAKDDTKDKERELKRLEKAEREAMKKKIYKEERGE